MRRDGSGQASVPSIVCLFCRMRSDRHLDPFDSTLGEDEVPLLLLLSEHCLLDLAGQDAGFIEQQLEPAAQFVDAVVQLRSGLRTTVCTGADTTLISLFSILGSSV